MSKKLRAFGVASPLHSTPEIARSYTYEADHETDPNKRFPPTPFINEDNPFNEKVANAKNILEIGCGVGRNVSYLMENTSARYTGIDPNKEGMLKHFWDIVPETYRDRVKITDSFDDVEGEKFDLVVCTFVLQHIGYRPDSETMNIDDITQKVMAHTSKGTVWFLLEHNFEEDWQGRWMSSNGIKPDVFISPWTRFPELGHRTEHNLIIWEEK